MLKVLTYIILFLFPFYLFGQEYNYVHYDTKDGLAGSTVYDIFQDYDGFIWFATEFGVSRFDGKKYINFTTDNGLTDNEVLRIYSTKISRRVWMFPFNKSICYYHNGKIVNACSEYHLNPERRISYYESNNNGELYIICNSKIYLLKNNGEKRCIADIKDVAHKFPENIPAINDAIIFSHLERNEKKCYFSLGNILFRLNDTGLVLIKGFDTSYINNLHDKRLAFFLESSLNTVTKSNQQGFIKNYKDGIVSICPIDSELYIVSTANNKCFFMNSAGFLDIKKPLLNGKKISRIYKDNEQNIWFTTLGDGIYKLSSASIKTFNQNKEYCSITQSNDKIYAGSLEGELIEVNNDNYVKKNIFNNYDINKINEKRLFCLNKDNDSNCLYLGFDCYLLKKENNKIIYSPIRPIKSIDIYDQKSIVVATNAYVFKLNKSNLNVTDTLLYERGTKVICDKGKVYIGTLKGFVMVDENKRIYNLSEHLPILQRRIVDMVKMKDGSLWIATNDTGILHYSKGKIDIHLTTANNLSSNLCRSLYLDNNNLWVGTNKGINKVDVSTNRFTVIKYSTSDGLPSDIINAIYAKDSTIYIGSPSGLTYFNENSISQNSICNLIMENVTVSDKNIDSFHNIQLDYKNNNISFNYTAISFKSGGNIIYKYKLYPLDNDWKETRLNSLSYPSLPSGKYHLQLYAVNKFGKKSSIINIDFEIETPFWKTIWFLLLVFAISLLGIAFFIRLRFLKIQNANNEKSRIKQQLAILEQNALQAQMNPHFIFNCLNSIQQFIMLNDKERANKYLTEFANLIRTTFDNSSKKNITVAEEVSYLDKYLDLEQLRYGDNFSYDINIDSSVERDFTEMPAMLLQPYVENCLRHGIRNKKEGKGIIVIRFTQKENALICSVKDNGVGRAAAAVLKSKEHIEYQSKGMQLTERRIQLLNTGLENNITVDIIDLKNEDDEPCGTKVIIEIPLY